MRVRFYLADQNPDRDRERGILEYTAGLLDHLRLRSGVSVSCLVSASSFRPRGVGLDLRAMPFRTDRPFGRFLADHLHPLWGGEGADLWHYPNGFLSRLKRPRVPTAGTVHDAILDWYARHHPDEASRAAYAYWTSQLAHSIARFDLVLTVSEFSRRAIQEFCSRRGVTCPPIEVTGQGGRWESEEPAPDAKRDCVVHLCSPLPHKGTDRLLELWERLERETDDLPRLRLIGRRSERQEKTVDRLRHAERFGPLPAAQLRTSLESARALILPSEIEGFGVPALEAWYLGTPVVYARGTAVDEVMRDAPGGFEPGAFESFRAALEEALDLDRGRVREIRAGLRRRFAWSACVERTLAAWRRLL